MAVNEENFTMPGKLNENMVLYGFTENPYPFLKACDVYVQPSRYEGFGIAISEADYLNSPLVITPDAGERYGQSKYIRIIPYGDENQWATAIEDILKEEKRHSFEKLNENFLTVSSFNKMLLHLFK